MLVAYTIGAAHIKLDQQGTSSGQPWTAETWWDIGIKNSLITTSVAEWNSAAYHKRVAALAGEIEHETVQCLLLCAGKLGLRQRRLLDLCRDEQEWALARESRL